MKLLTHTHLDDLVVKSLLLNGEQEVIDIYKDLVIKGQNITIQALYKRLRILLEDQIILKNKKFIVINNEWSESMLELLSGNNGLPILKPGETAIYSFKELASLDAYWKHIMTPIEKAYPNYPIFFFNHYEIWIQLTGRKDNEIDYLKRISQDKHYCFFLLGKDNKYNQSFKQKYQTDYLQISVGADGFSPSDYPTVIADYIITTKLSPRVAKLIDDIYTLPSEEILSQKINKIFSKSAAIKLKIERNENKAKKLRKKIAKDFYIPKEIKEKYNLF